MKKGFNKAASIKYMPSPSFLLSAGFMKFADVHNAWQSIDGCLHVIFSVEDHDGGLWMHASVARERLVPGYADLVRVKDAFIGADRKAVMVFAPKDEHVNIHPNALHLYALAEGDPLPDFRIGGGI